MHQKHHESSKPISSRRASRISNIRKEILKTLLYSDLFHYPLTGDQIFQYMGVPVKGKDFISALKTVPYMIRGRTIYYHLPKHQKFVEERLEKEKWNKKKIEKAAKVAKMLGLLPMIRFIGISGSLALKNAERTDDADLFFICAPHTVWFTRLVVYVILQLMGIKRKKTKQTSEMICANMFMDQRFLAFPKVKRNLYIAHEVVQVLPVVDKGNFKNQFLLANAWIKNYFPNIILPKKKKKYTGNILWIILRPLEYALFLLQRWYMRHNITRETITENVIAFHPVDYENHTLSLYNKKSLAYEI